MHDLHHLDLVELVLADHAARVLAVAARFRAEARRVRGQLDRQRVGGEDLVAHGVGERDLRRRDQVEPLALRLRRRPSAPRTCRLRTSAAASVPTSVSRVDDVRRVALGVAVLARLHVEHELRERAVQPREVAAQEREARAGELRRRSRSRAARGLRRGRRGPSAGSRTARGVPQRRTSTLSSVDGRPARSRAAGSAGSAGSRAARPARDRARLRGASTSSPMPATSAISGAASSPLPLRADLLRQRVAPRLQLLGARLDVLALALRAPRSARCRA